MADIWKAYNFLNESLGLNLSEKQLEAAEQAFMEKWIKEQGMEWPEDFDWEFLVHVEPRPLPRKS